MSRADEVLNLLADVALPLDDDDIANRLDIDRHYVNAVCRQLAEAGLTTRAPGPNGKFVNTVVVGGDSACDSSGAATTRAKATRRVSRDERARRNVEELITEFSAYVDRFETSEAFPGPSLYFHERALARRRSHPDVASLLADDLFFEYVYAVLPAWGMHRMGNQAAKVGSFSSMVESFRACRSLLESLWTCTIIDIASNDAGRVADEVWEVVSRLQVSTSGTRIVAGSKALHHVLPDLVPPIDREYTFRLFTGQKSVTGGEARAFREWFPYFCEIGRRCASDIEAIIDRGGFMATGRAKVIDNAIMGFTQSRRSSVKGQSDAAG